MRNSIDLLFSIAEVNIDFIKINIIDMFISVTLCLRDTRMYLMKILEVVKITVTVESWYTLSFASLETHWDLFSYTSHIFFTLSTLRLKVETYEEHICRTSIWTFVWEMVEGSSLSCRCYVFQVIPGELLAAGQLRAKLCELKSSCYPSPFITFSHLAL